MFLSVDNGNYNVELTDGNGKAIKNCIEIDTDTGEALVFIDWDRPEAWPSHWKFGEFVGIGGGMKAKGVFALPITITMESGVVVQNELQLAVANRFAALASRLDRKSKEHKQHIEDFFINLRIELARAKLGTDEFDRIATGVR